MELSYNMIRAEFLSMINDPKFLSLDTTDAIEMMDGWLKTALSDVNVQRIFSTKKYENDINLFTFELKSPNKNDIQGDLDYVTKVIATGMLIAWLQPKVTTTVNIHQILGGKEEKFYSQSSHLQQLRELLYNSKLELKKMIRDRATIHNKYLEGD